MAHTEYVEALGQTRVSHKKSVYETLVAAATAIEWHFGYVWLLLGMIYFVCSHIVSPDGRRVPFRIEDALLAVVVASICSVEHASRHHRWVLLGLALLLYSLSVFTYVLSKNMLFSLM